EAKKLDRQREKATESLSRLEHDRMAMRVPSPASGIVYQGTFDRGKWSGVGALKNRLRRGGALKPHEVFMTIVSPGPLFMRATVTEKDIRSLKPGAKGKVKAIAYPDLKLAGTVREISATPVAPGKFDVVVDVPMPKEAANLLPGMNCKIEIVTYRSEKALVVPSAAVFTDQNDDELRVVYLQREGKKPARRVVKVGKKSGDQTEILGGLKHGQKILAEKPEK
ncbi:MAG: HlyD family efflux transporter periplasmic adaptor subunit, partial [Opitutales bacterium]